MNYYELTFTYTSPVETSIINDVLAAELGEIGFESFAENENGLQGYISDQLYNVKGLQDKLAEFPLENVDIHFTETLVESKDWNEELLAELMDTNSRRSTPWEARQVMYEALITSAIESARRAEAMGMDGNQIILSCKVSGVQDLISVYRELARRCDYALHLGLTEAGMGTKGTVASATALSILLQEGIGDTIRVSLTPQPGEARTQEVVVASEILQSLGLRMFVPSVTACPGCGRTTSTTFQDLAKQIDDFLRAQMPVWRVRYPGV